MLTRNLQSHFAQLPQVSKQRSKISRSFGHKTTFNAGNLIPLCVAEVLPGDTIARMKKSNVLRLSTPIHPTMDNCNFETFWFFVPNRLLWDDWEHFITGGLDAGEWDAPTVYSPPMVRPVTQVSFSNQYQGFPAKSVADYMGIPCGSWHSEDGSQTIFPDPVDGVSALPFRAYAKIWNDWFRSSEIQEEILIPTETGGLVTPILYKSNPSGTGMVDATSVYGGSLLRANRYHDYFSSALQEPQRGMPVGIPVDLGRVPVVTGPISDYADGQTFPGLRFAGSNYLSANALIQADGFVGNTKTGDLTWNTEDATGTNSDIRPINLWGDFTDANNTANISINDLRHAAAIQHILETDARGGGRYIEQLQAHFGVTSSDARLQRAEYLGGNSVPINMTPVPQTSSTDNVSPQGNVSAYSWTSDVSIDFSHSFTEHGILMCLGVVRHVRTYQQGLNKMWSRNSRYDYYWPELANISEQPILNKEIYLSGSDSDNEVFGYNEPWAEYRYLPSYVTGALRSNYPQSLDVWHYADYYQSLPHLSSDWLLESDTEIDRTLAVSSAVEDQFIADIWFDADWYSVMPVYGVPGLDRI